MPPRRELSLEEYVQGVREGRRPVLARAITLVESARPDHRALARRLVDELLPLTGQAVRVGITGPPGVGKSTLIEELGLRLTGRGHRVAVLAVDPSSRRTGGSILGDKTRMERLSLDPRAYIRPSPGGDSAGGVARRSREALLLCEAAGHDVVLVETIGVGQSETAVAEMVDTFVLLVLPGSGDDLQGVKRGVMELADVAVVTKADAGHLKLARQSRRELASALHLMLPGTPGWTVPVLTCSARTGEGLDEVWQKVLEHRDFLHSRHLLPGLRARQAEYWLERALHDALWERFEASPGVAERLRRVRQEVREGLRSPEGGAEEVLGPPESTSR